MGALYKTASPETVDFMYQLPQEQLIAAMKVNEQNIDTQYQQAAVLNDQLLKLKSLAADQPEVKAYLDEMEEKVNSLTKTLQNDPMAWKKQMPLVRDLGQQIHKDFTRGKAAHWQSQYDAFQAADTKEKARIGLPIDKGGITPEQYTAWKKYTLSGFKEGSEYDDAAGTGKSIGIENVYGNQNIPEKIQKFMKDQIANSDSHFNVHTGQWVYTDKTTHESMTQEEVIRNATNLAMADPDIMGYARQMQSWNPNFGYSEKDASGQDQFIAPYTVDDKGRMSVNNKSFMAPALRGLAGVYGFDKITKDGTVPGANPFDLQQRAYDLTDRNAQRKFDREKPPVQQDVVAYTTNMPMFKPGEFTMQNFDDAIAEYNKSTTHTPEQEVAYQNAVRAKASIEEGARAALKKQGVSDADIATMLPYAAELSTGLKPPVNGAKSDLWTTREVPVPGLSMYSTQTTTEPVLTAKGKAIKALWDKNKAAQTDLAKAVEDGNSIQVYNVDINGSKDAVGLAFTASGTALANSVNSEILDANGQPLTLHFDNAMGFWDSFLPNGKKNKVAITSMADLIPYCDVVGATRGMTTGSLYKYKINPQKLADAGIALEGSNGEDYNGIINARYYGSDATEIENKALQKATPTKIVKSLINASDPILSNVYSQMLQAKKPATGFTDFSSSTQGSTPITDQTTVIIPYNDGNASVVIYYDANGLVSSLDMDFPAIGYKKTNWPVSALLDENGNPGPPTFENVAAKISGLTESYNKKFWGSKYDATMKSLLGKK